MNKTDWNERTRLKLTDAIQNSIEKEAKLRQILKEAYKKRDYVNMSYVITDLIVIAKMRHRMFKMRDAIRKQTILKNGEAFIFDDGILQTFVDLTHEL